MNSTALKSICSRLNVLAIPLGVGAALGVSNGAAVGIAVGAALATIMIAARR